MRHPCKMGVANVEVFLSILANERKVSTSTYNQAHSSGTTQGRGGWPVGAVGWCDGAGWHGQPFGFTASGLNRPHNLTGIPRPAICCLACPTVNSP